MAETCSSDKEDGLAVNDAEEEEAARWLLKAGERLVQRLCVIIITIVGSSLFIASVIIITIAITLEDLREKDGACGGSTSATILQGACPAGSLQFDHDVYTFVVLEYLSQTEKICIMDGFRPTFTDIGCFSGFPSELQNSNDNEL